MNITRLELTVHPPCLHWVFSLLTSESYLTSPEWCLIPAYNLDKSPSAGFFIYYRRWAQISYYSPIHWLVKILYNPLISSLDPHSYLFPVLVKTLYTVLVPHFVTEFMSSIHILISDWNWQLTRLSLACNNIGKPFMTLDCAINSQKWWNYGNFQIMIQFGRKRKTVWRSQEYMCNTRRPRS